MFIRSYIYFYMSLYYAYDEWMADSSLYQIIEFLLVWSDPRGLSVQIPINYSIFGSPTFPRSSSPSASDCSHTDNDIERHLVERWGKLDKTSHVGLQLLFFVRFF